MESAGEVVELNNVVRFPIERRASLSLFRQIAPDAREVGLLADTFDIALPLGLEARADQSTAEYIANQIPETDRNRPEMLRTMLAETLATAVRAVRDAERLARDAAMARAELAAGADLGYAQQALEHTNAELALNAAEALVVAHGRALGAYGAARAIDLALRGEPWMPRQVNAEMTYLMEAELARRAI